MKLLFFSYITIALFFTFGVNAQEPYRLTIDDVDFDEMSQTILNYSNSSEKDIVVPDFFIVNDQHVRVYSIAQGAFANKSLTSLTLEGGYHIGKYAFANNLLTTVNYDYSNEFEGGAFNNNLISEVNGQPSNGIFYSLYYKDGKYHTEVMSYGGVADVIDFIANDVTQIGRYAFAGNSITSVTIPSNVIHIGDYSFENNSLSTVKLPNSVTSVGNGAFKNNSLTSVSISNSVKTIGIYAFKNNLLTSVVIPSSVTSILNSAFENNSLTSVSIPNSITSIRQKVFSGNSLTSIEIPNSVTSIGLSAFKNNSLTSLVIPNSVTYIAPHAFDSNLLSSVIIPDNVIDIEFGAFNNNAISKVNGNISNGIIYARNEDGSDNNTTIVSYGGDADIVDFIPNSVTTIEPNAFENSSLISVIIPSSVTYIGTGAFSENSLNAITIPNNVIYIGYGAFLNNSFNSFNLPIHPEFNSYGWTDYRGATYSGDDEVLVSTSYCIPGAYAINYILNGGVNALDNPNSYHKDRGVTVINQPTKIGYIFDGWFDSDGIEITSIPPGREDNIILYASWNINYYNVTIDDVVFDATNGTIYSYIGDEPNIIIPSSFIVDGVSVPVVAIADEAFSYSPDASLSSLKSAEASSVQLTSVELPTTISKIGADAFSGNDLSSIILPQLNDEKGKVFVGWEDENGISVTEITDYSLAYNAVFDITTSLLTNNIDKEILIYPNPASQFL